MPLLKRCSGALAAVAVAAGMAAPAALGSTTQQFVIQDDHALRVNVVGTLTTMHDLGATVVKVTVPWYTVAPNALTRRAPAHFTASNPAAYPAANWVFYDSVVREAKKVGIKVMFMPSSPAPLWATAPGVPATATYKGAWKPSAADFGAFMKALGTRYSGHYKPPGQTTALPRVSIWSIWNEPNYGPDLAPQAIDNNTVYVAAQLYRALLSHAWGALAQSGHTTKTDTILIGETAPRGVAGKGLPGNFAGTMPVIFLQSLYCVNAGNHELTGNAAKQNGCPGSASAFRAQNPALFNASGYADHPYAQGVVPGTPTYACSLQFCWNYRTKQSTPGYLDFAEVGRLETLLQHLSQHSWSIWNTEFGYWTTPPDTTSNPIERHEAVSPATAALYMNWAEYLSYQNPHLASYSQYLIVDPVGYAFSTGLELNNGRKLATYAAYQTPLFMPKTTAGPTSPLTVWGGVRPAASLQSASSVGKPQAKIQFQAGGHGAWATVKTVTITSPRGYFSVKVPFTTSGNVRIAWSNGATTNTSRTQAVTIR